MMTKFANEIARAMNDSLTGSVDNKSDAATSALACLDLAAQLFDQAGNEVCAEAVTNLMTKVSIKISQRK